MNPTIDRPVDLTSRGAMLPTSGPPRDRTAEHAITPGRSLALVGSATRGDRVQHGPESLAASSWWSVIARTPWGVVIIPSERSLSTRALRISATRSAPSLILCRFNPYHKLEYGLRLSSPPGTLDQPTTIGRGDPA